jgi:hypothetical protein
MVVLYYKRVPNKPDLDASQWEVFYVVANPKGGTIISPITGAPVQQFQMNHADEAAAEAYLGGLFPAKDGWHKAKK